jgi:hypothetical protein
MNPSAKDENPNHAAIDAALESEERAENLAISNSLILAPRHELLRTEAGLKREAEEAIGTAKPERES